MYPGFPSRLEKEMKQLYLTRVLGNDTSRLKVCPWVLLVEWCLKMYRSTLRSELKILLDENTWCSWVVQCLPIL